MQALDPRSVLKLAEQYIAIYSDLIKKGVGGDTTVDQPMCQYMVKCWESIREKGGVLDSLTFAEAQEVKFGAFPAEPETPEVVVEEIIREPLTILD